MLYGKYVFSNLFEHDALLPEYKGSTLRGVFGHALKKVVCALKRQDCHECLLKDKCVYSFIFEAPTREDAPSGKRRIASPPHPYVIEPPETTKTYYQKGEQFNFILLLFGKANDYLPYFIYAFEQIGKLGVGKSINGKRAGFLLQRVSADHHLIYATEDRKIRQGGVTQELGVEDFQAPESPPVNCLELTLKTPLRLKYQNHLEATLPLHALTRTMLRRISSLHAYYGNGEPALHYRGLVKRAAAIKVRSTSLEWFDWKRYSSRQDQAMLMGGLVGQVTYEGDLTEFVPLIRFCEKVHLGKQTSFGLGKIEVSGIKL